MITNQNQFRIDEFTEKLLTLEYKQFIIDHKTAPEIEIISSQHITTIFLENCYKNALKEFSTLSSKRKSLIFLSFKHACSDLSLNFPKEIVLSIIQIYHKVNKQSNIGFYQLYDEYKEYKYQNEEAIKYFECMEKKKINEKKSRIKEDEHFLVGIREIKLCKSVEPYEVIKK